MKIHHTLMSAFAAVAALFVVASADATPITGQISFFGQATLNPPNFATATTASAFQFTVVAPGAEGDFSGSAAFSPASFGSIYDLDLNPLTSFVVSFGDFVFTLTSSAIDYEASGLVVSGLGTLSGVGYDDTVAFWSFASDFVNPATGKMNFTATIISPAPSTVPDGGSTVLLLGVVVLGVVFARRGFSMLKA